MTDKITTKQSLHCNKAVIWTKQSIGIIYFKTVFLFGVGCCFLAVVFSLWKSLSINLKVGQLTVLICCAYKEILLQPFTQWQPEAIYLPEDPLCRVIIQGLCAVRLYANSTFVNVYCFVKRWVTGFGMPQVTTPQQQLNSQKTPPV
jgi:hypothetical protein